MTRFITTLLLSFATIFAMAQANNYIGRWTTIDDKTGEAISIVRIYRATNGKYYGKIERLLPKGHQDDLCVKCKGDLKDKPIVGLVILRDMELIDGELRNGSVLDPNNGNTYYGKIKYDATNNTLILRGSLDKRGIIGRSQTWQRHK